MQQTRKCKIEHLSELNSKAMGNLVAQKTIHGLTPVRTRETLQDIFGTENFSYSLKCRPIEREWKESLKGCWWASNYEGEFDLKINPKLYTLRDRLLSFGGEEVCVPSCHGARLRFHSILWTIMGWFSGCSKEGRALPMSQ